MEQPQLPAYRQLSGAAHYYRILSLEHFQELQRIGSRWVLHEVHAAAYPERLRVHEMLACTAPFVELDQGEWVRAFADLG